MKKQCVCVCVCVCVFYVRESSNEHTSDVRMTPTHGAMVRTAPLGVVANSDKIASSWLCEANEGINRISFVPVVL